MSEDLVYGRHAVNALLEHDPAGVRELWLQASRRDPLSRASATRARRHGVVVHRVERRTLDRITGSVEHQGIAARYRAVDRRLASSIDEVLAGAPEDAALLLLDGVQDPRNLGACLRSANAAGAVAVIIPRSRGVGLTAAARKVASGAAESLPLVVVPNLAASMSALADGGFQLLGLAADARDTIYDAAFSGKVGLVLGAEDRGLRRLTRARCDRLVRIPMTGVVESLNVATAAAVVLFEVQRRRALQRMSP